MINKYLFSVFSTFSNEDWKEYKIYVKSCDVISSRKYYPLVSVLMKFSSKIDDLKTVATRKLFKKAYKKIYDAQTILNRQTELLNLTRKFLENYALKKNYLNKLNLYLQELLSRNLLDLYLRDSYKAKDDIKANIFNEDAYKHLQELVLANGAYCQLKKKQKLSMDFYFSHSKILLADILCSLYRTGQELQIQKYSSLNYGFNPVLEFIDSVISDKFFDKLEKQNDKIFTISLIRYYVFKSVQNPDDTKYISKALNIFFTDENNFTEYFRTEMYRMFMTYYIIKTNNGETKYYRNLFLLYKRKLCQNLVSDLKVCSYPANVFREYILTGIKVRQYKWVENVIEKYSSLLPKNIRDDEINLAMIRLSFSRKEYKKTLELISNHKSKNNTHHLDSMRYKLASFYELKRYEEAYYEVDREKHYLKYNKNNIPELNQKYFKSFLDKILKLLNYHANPFNKDPEIILYEIENDETRFMMKDWIGDKARELLNNNERNLKYIR
jgi:hypothetical protein